MLKLYIVQWKCYFLPLSPALRSLHDTPCFASLCLVNRYKVRISLKTRGTLKSRNKHMKWKGKKNREIDGEEEKCEKFACTIIPVILLLIYYLKDRIFQRHEREWERGKNSTLIKNATSFSCSQFINVSIRCISAGLWLIQFFLLDFVRS